MNKQQKLAPNRGLVPIMIRAPFSLAAFLKKLKRKEALLQYRLDMEKATRRQNYINEYDRIAGLLNHSVTHRHMDHKRLMNRQEELKKLFDDSFDKPRHEISRK